jgi:hypothetical protein
MTTLELNLALPDQLAREAEPNGLLQPEALERLLRDEIRRRTVGDLSDAADRWAPLPEPPLTGAELQAEIQAARTETDCFLGLRIKELIALAQDIHRQDWPERPMLVLSSRSPNTE